MRKGHLQYCCSQVWMKNGGQIPWNVTAICETFKISCLMGRHHLKGGSECLLTDQFSRLEQWSNITPSLRKTYRDYINLAQKSCQINSLDVHNTPERIWKGDIPVADIEELEEMDASELHARRLNAKEVLTPMNGEKFIFPVADGTVNNFWGRSGSQNIHLDPGEPRQTRRTRWSSRRIRRVFFNPTRRLIMVLWWSQKWFFGLSQEISIHRHHVEPELNCICRLKNHSLRHWNTLTLPELPTQR